MATDNKGVTVYLPQDLEECLTQYCTEYGITRKAKDGTVTPSLGTGIITYLKEKMMSADPSVKSSGLSNISSNGLTADDVRSLINQAINPLTNLTHWDELKAEVTYLRERLEVMATKDYVHSVLGTNSIGREKVAPIDTPNPMTPDTETLKWVERLRANPELKAATQSGIEQGFNGQRLMDWVFQQGFGSRENSKPFHVSVASRLKNAIDRLNGENSGGIG